MKRVLINLVHPNLDESRVNKFLSQKASKLENVTVNNLYAKYPDFHTHVRGLAKLIKEDPGNIQRELKKLDKVAYIRFASVYRNFEDAEEFSEVIREVTTRPRGRPPKAS